MRLWKGDSRGTWEGDTFVVTTTNFTGETAFRGTGPNLRLTSVSPGSTRIGCSTTTRSTIRGRTSPWSTAVEMRRTDDLIFEYACHEGNYAMELMLSGARGQEREGRPDDTWLPSWSRPARR
jgi:hypothetical protein